MNHWAIIPSGARPRELAGLITTLVEDDVNVVLVNTGYEYAEYTDHLTDKSVLGSVHLVEDFTKPRNISRWWNQGLAYARALDGNPSAVFAVLNDDLEVDSGFIGFLGEALERHGAAAACPDVYSLGQDLVIQDRGHPLRMAGFAFALTGRHAIWADESLVWWYGDNDIDWQARDLGGVVVVGGLRVRHLYPNSTTVDELAVQAGVDRQTFIRKWGSPPW